MKRASWRCAYALDALGKVCDSVHIVDNSHAQRKMSEARFQLRKLARMVEDVQGAVEQARAVNDNAGLDDVIARIMGFADSGR